MGQRTQWLGNKGKTISIWGLSFKPNTASIDNTPSIKVIDALLSQGALIKAHDPAAMGNIDSKYADNPGIKTCASGSEALDGSNALILLTEWSEYSSPDFNDMKQRMKSAVIIDGRNLLDKNQAVEAGFYYEGIGR